MEGSGMEGNGLHRYLVFVWSPKGYVLEERPGEPPRVGTEIEEGARRYRVTKLAPSPLPGDSRPCAYLLPTST
jgi:hypothetical protein